MTTTALERVDLEAMLSAPEEQCVWRLTPTGLAVRVALPPDCTHPVETVVRTRCERCGSLNARPICGPHLRVMLAAHERAGTMHMPCGGPMRIVAA
jgi:hypothetical protein